MLIDKTIRLFLDGIGKREEYEFYLHKFQAADKTAFALILPDIDSLRQGANVLMFDLQFLLQLDLLPVVALAGPGANEMRDLLAAHGESCDVIEDNAHTDDSCRIQWIQNCADRRRVPVLCMQKDLPNALTPLVPNLARRVHLVRSAGWLRSGEGEPMYHYYTRRKNDDPVHPDDAGLAKVCHDIVERAEDVHLSVTSPLHLLKELFTVKGAGTVIRRGSEFFRASHRRDVDEAMLADLLEDSFGKKIDSFQFLDTASDFLVESEYRAAALLEPHEIGSFLSKFAVGAEARGEGLAQELWNEVVSRHAKMFWRSRVNNPINQWYRKKADGRHTLPDWLVFWRGIPAGDIPVAIDVCRSRPADFKETTD
jgi:acetylglutamate kinase